MSFRTKADERKFIRDCLMLYRQLPALWNTKSPDYNNKKLKSEQYRVLLKKYREKFPYATKDQLVKKLNSLRTNFRKELKRLKEAERSGNIDECKSSLWYFNEMKFLTDMELQRSLSRGGGGDGSVGEASSSRTRMHHHLEIVQVDVDDEAGEEDEEDEEEEGNSDSDYSQNEGSQREQLSRQQNQLADCSANSSNHRRYHQTLPHQTHQAHAPPPPTKEYDMITQVWAAELQKMTKQQQLFAKKAINEILFEGQMGTLQRDSVQINVDVRTASPTISHESHSSEHFLESYAYEAT